MNNPFNLTDEQIDEIERKHTQYECFNLNGETHSGLAITSSLKTFLADVERMAKENAEAAFTVDWDNVPDWANVVAADCTGAIYAYMRKPRKVFPRESWADGAHARLSGYSQAVADGKIDWSTTLREQPKKEVPSE